MKKKEQPVTNQKRTGMLSERVISFIERNLLVTLLVLAFGLIYSGDSGRGWPVPWISGSHLDGSSFILSFFIVFAVVVCANAVAGVFRAAKEPLASVLYKQYSSVSPYETDIPEDVKVTEAPRTDQLGHLAGKLDIPAVRSLSKALEAGTTPSVRDAEPVLAGLKNKKGPSLGQATGKTAKKGASAVITVIVIIIAVISFGMSLFDGDIDFDTDDWSEDITVEESDELDSIRSSLFSRSSDDLKMLLERDADSIAAVGEGDVDKILDITDWNNTKSVYQFCTNIYEPEDEEAEVSDNYSAVVLWLLETNGDPDDRYMAAFKYTDVSDAEDSGSLVGISVCPLDPEWLLYTPPDDDEEEPLREQLEERSASVGDHHYYGDEITAWWDHDTY